MTHNTTIAKILFIFEDPAYHRDNIIQKSIEQIHSLMKISKHSFKIILKYQVYFDTEKHKYIVKSLNYNYCLPYINQIIYYRSLFLQGRCDKEKIDPSFEFVCCYAPMWVVIMVCGLLVDS